MKNIFAILLALLFTLPGQAQEKFHPLFDGTSLKGWKSYGGDAPFMAENGELVGQAVPNTPNTFLCTEERYSNFILELEFFPAPPLNSGVMVRGQWKQDGERTKIYGYQVEIDPSSRGYTGGIFDEQRRKWLYPVHYNDPARTALQYGKWNKMRVEFLGQNVRTYINGQAVANLVDDLDSEGMICLQVHSIRDDLARQKMRWRDIRINTSPTQADLWTKGDLIPQFNMVPNALTQDARDKGWRLLWDGKTTTGWRGAKLDGFPTSGWEIADGELRVQASDGGESTNGGDIVTTKHYGDFELRFEFKPSEGANSGVKYYVDPTLNKGAGSAIGLEFQILDDKRHPDAKKGVGGKRTAGSLYDLIKADPIDTNRSKDIRIGEWNRGRIVSKDGKVQHWLNGYKVIEYDRFSQTFEALVAYSKYKDWPNFGQYASGPILLQDHGDAVSFRSIKIREL